MSSQDTQSKSTRRKYPAAFKLYLVERCLLAGASVSGIALENGINANVLCPGWTNTSLLDFDRMAAARGITVDEARGHAAGESLQRRILEAEELAGMATLLAADDGRGITGQVISVDGGYKV